MPLGPQIVTYGNIQSSFILTPTLTPVSVATITSAEQTFTIQGLQVGDQVTVTPNFAVTNLVDIVAARVTAANTLGVSFQNGTAGPLTPGAGVYAVEVNRPMAGMAMTSIQ
jgi:hypothetical protein